MTEKEKEQVIEFYNREVWTPGMTKSDELTENNLKFLRGTFWFARWNLAYHFDKVVLKPIQEILDRLIN